MSDVKEIMEYLQQEETFNVKEFLFKLLAKWRLFLIFGIISAGIGLYIGKSTPPTYEVSGLVLVNEESSSGGMNSLFEDLSIGGNTNIENHLLTFKSYTLHHQTLQRLNLNVSWYRKDMFRDVSLYKDAPFIIDQIPGEINLSGVVLNVEPISEQLCKITVDQKVNIAGVDTELEFEEIVEYGVPLIKKYFHFTITKKDGAVIPIKNSTDFSLKSWISPKSVGTYNFLFNNLEVLVKYYQSHTSVQLANSDAEGIQLSVKDGNPARAVDFLNELIEVYLDYGLSQKNRTSENTVRFIDAQLSQLVDSLNHAGKNFTDFRSRHGIVNLSQEADLVVERLEGLESQRAAVQQRVDYYRSLESYIGSAEKADLIVAPSVMGITDVSLNSQLVRLTELYNRKSNWSFVAKENNPGILMIDQEINSTLRSLKENLKNLFDNAENELKALETRISRINMELAGLPKTEQQLINIKRSFDLNNELYTFLLEKRAEAAITTASNVPDAYVLDPARLESAVQVGPKTKRNLAIGLLVGLAIPFIFIVLGDFFNESIQSKDELEKGCKVPLAGEIAHNKYKTELPVLENPRSGIAENFRGVQVGLRHIFRNKDPKVFAIHSMFPGEGKTFTAVNLAGTLATDNKKVLLVGCDLRKPKLHSVFHHDNKKGVSNYLTNNDSFEDVILPTEYPNLYYVSSGPVPPNPSALIGNGVFEAFVEKAKKHFDFIVLDNAPVTLVSDGLLAGQYADVNLFILRQGHSNKKQMKYINGIGKDERLKNVGVILNDTVYSGYGYSSYGNYGYGYGYYEGDEEKGKLKSLLFKRFSRS
ncbi:GumC family protein [Saccharicrinis sp. 156]|uniref:GumC family protein n=1 Tax=Saccharicrinis sp. 156 TaxID=3417574 RepID=UPI003D33DE7C